MLKILDIPIVIFYVIYILHYSIQAKGVSEEYPLVEDQRNFREKKGSKKMIPQGVILSGSTMTITLCAENIQPQSLLTYPWRYVAAVNCKRGSRNLFQMIKEITSMLPMDEVESRIAIILGINEKITIENLSQYQPSWEELFPYSDSLPCPILVQYTQWTPFRHSVEEPTLTPRMILDNINTSLNSLPLDIQQQERKKIKESDKKHGFPFGAMRTHLLQHQDSVEFIEQLGDEKTDVYVHVLDSDFISLNPENIFLPFISEQSIISHEEHYLLRRYDALIQHYNFQNCSLPLVVGGAYSFSAMEVFKPHTFQAKMWTCFAAEMSNMLKHLLGQQQPYGIYFHEPNILLLSPQSFRRHNKDRELLLLENRLKKGFKFGMLTEVRSFTRSLFSGISGDNCRRFMVFSADVTVKTSMKRDVSNPFTLNFSGKYDAQIKKFCNWDIGDIRTLRSLAQGIIHPTKWMAQVATSFALHRLEDVRSKLCDLYKLFDPFYMFMDKTYTDNAKELTASNFYQTLVCYDKKLKTKQRKKTLRMLFERIRKAYSKKKQGGFIAFNLFSLAWESGQSMRIMYLDYLQRPILQDQAPPTLFHYRKFLTKKFNYSGPLPNAYVFNLLFHDQIVSEIQSH